MRNYLALIRKADFNDLYRYGYIRIDSEFFGQYREFELSAENNRLLWMPPGFANGFSAESEVTVIHYKCTEYWNAASEITLLYNDTDVNIDWSNFLMSSMDSYLSFMTCI